MKQSGSSSSAVMPQSEVKRGNFSTLLQNFRSGAQTDIAACCRLLAACNCDRHFLLAFAYLPEMLKLRPLTESEATEMISVMPMDLLQRMISNES
uniref:Neurochondrin n=1 Tax=Parascaris univalens TaxID=6257 RepID=A0A915BC30_PARUN